MKKSPVHLAVNKVIISGNKNCTFPVASIKTTVRLIVARTIPPNCDAAPSNAYFPKSFPICKELNGYELIQ